MLITKQKTGTKWAAYGILIALLTGCGWLDFSNRHIKQCTKQYDKYGRTRR